MINIEKDFKFKQNDKIVIGCSTGPDSMALVDMLLKIRNKYNLSLIIAHVNHNVRKESYEEAEFLKQYCIDNNLTKYHVEYAMELQYILDDFKRITNDDKINRILFDISILRDKIKKQHENGMEVTPFAYLAELKLIYNKY